MKKEAKHAAFFQRDFIFQYIIRHSEHDASLMCDLILYSCITKFNDDIDTLHSCINIAKKY